MASINTGSMAVGMGMRVHIMYACPCHGKLAHAERAGCATRGWEPPAEHTSGCVQVVGRGRRRSPVLVLCVHVGCARVQRSRGKRNYTNEACAP